MCPGGRPSPDTLRPPFTARTLAATTKSKTAGRPQLRATGRVVCRLVEPHFHVRSLFEVDGVNESYLPLIESHDQ